MADLDVHTPDKPGTFGDEDARGRVGGVWNCGEDLGFHGSGVAILVVCLGGFAGLSLLLLATWYILHRRKHKNIEMRELGEGYTAAGTVR